MPTINAKDGSAIFYKDWGKGRPIVFSHGWPLSADAWDEQLAFFAAKGFPAIALGRHGTGRVAKAVLVVAIPPLMLKTETNPRGLPIASFDQLRAGMARTRPSCTRTWRFRSTARTAPERP